MPGRSVPLATGEYYHIYNRGVEKRDIYLKPRDYSRFRQTFYYYQFSGKKTKFSQFTKSNLFKPILNEKLINILCYCLMPNHFHFLIKQLKEKGTSVFISQLINSYTKYFNLKYNRVGALLQGTFKAVRIETDEQLLHVSRYIHLNPVVSGIANKPENYQWSSYNEYLTQEPFYCYLDEISGFYKDMEDYKKFVDAQIDYGKKLEEIKHQFLDAED